MSSYVFWITKASEIIWYICLLPLVLKNYLATDYPNTTLCSVVQINVLNEQFLIYFFWIFILRLCSAFTKKISLWGFSRNFSLMSSEVVDSDTQCIWQSFLGLKNISLQMARVWTWRGFQSSVYACCSRQETHWWKTQRLHREF